MDSTLLASEGPSSPDSQSGIISNQARVSETAPLRHINPLSCTLISPVSELLKQESVNRLLHHFDKVVVQQLAWVDSADNPWRNAIIPLAMSFPALFHSALALAAGDIAVKSPVNSLEATNSLALSSKHRNTCLKLLAAELKSNLNSETHFEEVQNTTNCMLGTIMLLCNLEMMLPESSQWRLHLWGARTTIRRLGNTSHLPIPPDTIGSFLLQQFYVTNVCAFMTTFSGIEHMRKDTLTSDGNSIFTEFFRVLQAITETERRRSGNPQSFSDQTPKELADLREALLQARHRTIDLGQKLQFWSTKVRREFEHVVDLYQYMALIYGYRILLCHYRPHDQITFFKEQIFLRLRALEGNTAFTQDLVWPIFIAGTESRGIPEQQSFIEAKMLEVIRLTGPLERRQALKFLKEYWDLEDELDGGWIEFARRWAEVGNTFLVY
ncbi:hypothetical protein B7463_g2642, partial [Scytalidium lignicola]